MQDPRVLKEANALKDAGFNVHVISIGESKQKKFEEFNGINIYRISLVHSRAGIMNYLSEYIIFFIYTLYKVTLLHLKYQFAFVQVNTMPDFLVFATIFVKISGRPVFLDMHEIMPELFIIKFKKSPKSFIIRLLKFIEKISMKYADLVIYVNKSIFKYHAERGLKKEKALLLPNIPEDSMQKKSAIFLRNRKNHNSIILITHGTIEKRYGIQTAIKSIAILREIYPDIKLYIVGNGEYSSNLKKLSEELQLYNRNVFFTGYINFSKITEFLRKADFGIVPLENNIYTQIMTPNKLFEYVALKIPVIASDLNGIRDFFDDYAITFFNPDNPEDLASKILERINNMRKTSYMVENAFRELQDFNWSTTKEFYIKRINSILQYES